LDLTLVSGLSLGNNFWVNQIDTSQDFGLVRIEEFVKLWGLLNDVHLQTIFPTPFIGNSQIMESIPLLWPTRCTLKGLSQPLLILPFGTCGHLQNANSLHCWLDMIEFGRRIVYNEGVGNVKIVHFATKFKNRRAPFVQI
jgi:hypothetical protein